MKHLHNLRFRCRGNRLRKLPQVVPTASCIPVSSAAASARTISRPSIFRCCSTARATHDFGIRMALGAQAGHVLWLVLKKGLTLAAIGLVLGLGAALWLTRLIVSLLFGVSRNDAPTFAAVAAVTLLAALSACYLPARRATRVDPLEALRNE
ncbi:MAG TPA: FtsX-like permease family protein [Candidatus Angelobacter sp.]|nr:FtsX-like permease family protein [Candidatus Angelobacter sp.]